MISLCIQRGLQLHMFYDGKVNRDSINKNNN